MSELVGIEPFISFPINRQSAGYGFKQNSPLIEWRFEAQSSRLLDPSSLRFNGRLRINQGGNNTALRPDNQNSNATVAYDVKMDDRVSVQSLIDILRLRNLKSETIEEVRNYGRLISSVGPATTSYSMYKTHTQTKFCAPGNEPTIELMCNQDILFSIPLNAGLFMSGSNLNLADLGGLAISIMLNNDAQVLYGADASDGASYNIKDVSLTGDYFVFSAPQPPKAQVINYPAYNSFMTILNSGDDQQSLNLAQRSVRSLTMNTIPSSHLNNYSHNGYATPKLRNTNPAGTSYTSDADVLEYTFMKGAIKFPKQYSTTEREAVLNESFETKKNRDYLNSIRSVYSINSSLISPYTTNDITPNPANTTELDRPVRADVPDRNITGLGSRIDGLSNGQGSSYMDDTYTLRIISELDGKSPNSAFLYTLSNQALRNSRAGEIQAVQ